MTEGHSHTHPEITGLWNSFLKAPSDTRHVTKGPDDDVNEESYIIANSF